MARIYLITWLSISYKIATIRITNSEIDLNWLAYVEKLKCGLVVGLTLCNMRGVDGADFGS